jgi:uncharacterized membrane protein YbaN (DUF454 family)
MNFLKILLVSAGTLSLLIGLIGIVVPGVPTTPFLIITAGLYIRSSDKLYQKLISNKLLGDYILEYRKRKGMTKKAKTISIGIMWIMITLSAVLFIVHPLTKILVFLAGIIGTVVMGFIIPTIRNTEKD